MTTGIELINHDKYGILFSDRIKEFIGSLPNQFQIDNIMIGQLDESTLEELKQDVMNYWSDKPYKALDVLSIFFIEDLINHSDLKHIEYAMKGLKINLHVKERKKGKKAIFERVKKEYHKESIRKGIHFLFTSFLKDEIEACKFLEDDEEGTDEQKAYLLTVMSQEVGILPTLYITEKILKNEYLTNLLIEAEEARYVTAIVQSAYYYEEVGYEQIIEKPKKVVITPEQENKMLKTDLKRSNKALLKESKLLSKANQEIYELKQQIKKLTAENRELFEMNEMERNKYSEELASMESYYMQVIEGLTNDLETAHSETDTTTETISEKVDLNGQTVAVIGGSRERFFREIVEDSNGNMIFVSEKDYNKIAGAVKKASAVFYLKEVVSHDFFRQAYPLAKKYEVPFIYVNTLGTSTFKRVLKKHVA